MEEIYAAIQALVPFPRSGHARPDLSGRPVRFQLARDFLIAYAPDDKPLIVLAILCGRRNPRVMAAILLGREEHRQPHRKQ